MVQPIKITKKELESNFKNWITKWKPSLKPGNDLIAKIDALCPTHTFAFTKTTDGDITFPYKKIFGIGEDAQGLLSDAYRESNHLFAVSEKRRKMSAARKLGLDSYVFAYLGIHEAYYGRDDGGDSDMNPHPFGIFIKKDIETWPRCLPSRRDVNVHVKPKPKTLRKELLHPKDCRMLAAYQVENEADHGKDLWHYYGTAELCRDEDYCKDAWRRKIEYHYLEKLGPEDMSAVLWPVWQNHTRKRDVIEYHSSCYDISEIIGKFPDLKVITYEWDEAEPEMCFIEASYYLTRYLIKYNSFPASAEIAKSETYE